MAQVKFDKEFDANGIKKVFISNPNGRIEIRGWDKSLIRITADIEAAGSHVPDGIYPRIDHDSDSISVKCGFGGVSFSEDIDIHGIMENVHEIGDEVRASIDNFVADLTRNGSDDSTPNAEIHVHGSLDSLQDLPEKLKELKEKLSERAKVSGDRLFHSMESRDVRTAIVVLVPKDILVRAKSANGVITCDAITGAVDLKANNGQIRVSKVHGSIQVKSNNGLISLDACSPTLLVAKTMNGPIKASFNDITGEVSLKTVNGPVRAVFPGHLNLNLTIQSVSGPVRVPSAFESEIKSSRRFTGSLGNGEHSIVIKTVAGPITVALSSDPVPAKPPEKPAIPIPPEPPAPPEPAQDPTAMIQRMVQTGKITQEEADRLLSAVHSTV